jgi:hypothetical protein
VNTHLQPSFEEWGRYKVPKKNARTKAVASSSAEILQVFRVLSESFARQSSIPGFAQFRFGEVRFAFLDVGLAVDGYTIFTGQLLR